MNMDQANQERLSAKELGESFARAMGGGSEWTEDQKQRIALVKRAEQFGSSLFKGMAVAIAALAIMLVLVLGQKLDRIIELLERAK